MLKKANKKDLGTLALLMEEVQDLHHKMYPSRFKPYSEAKVEKVLKNFLENKETSVFIAYSKKDQPVGYIVFQKEVHKEGPITYPYKSIFIEHISVLESHHGKGIGKLLIEAAIEAGKKVGADCVELDVWNQNIAAKGFFEKLGFQTFNEKMSIKI